MGKISSYSSDTTPVPADYLLGNQSSGPTTVHFPVGKIANTGILTNPYNFSVYRSAALSIGTFAVVTFDTKEYDTGTNVDVATNKGRFTAPIAGFYHFDTAVNFFSITSGSLLGIAFYKNGSRARLGPVLLVGAGTQNEGLSVSATLLLAANDYVEVYAEALSGSFSVNTGADTAWFSGHLVSAF